VIECNSLGLLSFRFWTWNFKLENAKLLHSVTPNSRLLMEWLYSPPIYPQPFHRHALLSY